jgi:chitin synthase
MVEDEQISGCCGELEIDLNFNDLNESFWDNLEKKSILKAQWLEYKFSHCLQKTFESSCGFIPVLPGAFCAYRWSALKAKNYFVIKEYLKPFDQPHLIGWTQSNIYHLAEDRVILDKISKLDTETEPSCWSSGHFLTFIKDSKATTDGPESILQLINQRRRWNNGAWFSLNQTLWKTCNSKNICLTQHSPIRKLALILQVSYYILLVSFQWCSVGAFYLAFAMALRVRNT